MNSLLPASGGIIHSLSMLETVFSVFAPHDIASHENNVRFFPVCRSFRAI